MFVAVFILTNVLRAGPLEAGSHFRALTVEGRERSYLIHIPPHYDPTKATPVVLVFHGAAMNARITMQTAGMIPKSDEAGFIAVYPNGTGVGPFLTWNSGEKRGEWAKHAPNDVKFVSILIDDLQSVVNIVRDCRWPAHLARRKAVVRMAWPIHFDISATDLIWAFFQKHPMK